MQQKDLKRHWAGDPDFQTEMILRRFLFKIFLRRFGRKDFTALQIVFITRIHGDYSKTINIMRIGKIEMQKKSQNRLHTLRRNAPKTGLTQPPIMTNPHGERKTAPGTADGTIQSKKKGPAGWHSQVLYIAYIAILVRYNLILAQFQRVD